MNLSLLVEMTYGNMYCTIGILMTSISVGELTVEQVWNINLASKTDDR